MEESRKEAKSILKEEKKRDAVPEEQPAAVQISRVNQEEKDTPRIDVKRDISISEKTKKKTQSINDLMIQKRMSTQQVAKPSVSDSQETPQDSKD